MHNSDCIIGMFWDCPVIFTASLDGGIIISQSFSSYFSLKLLPIFAAVNAVLMKMFTYVPIVTYFGLSGFLGGITVFFYLFQWLLIVNAF